MKAISTIKTTCNTTEFEEFCLAQWGEAMERLILDLANEREREQDEERGDINPSRWIY